MYPVLEREAVTFSFANRLQSMKKMISRNAISPMLATGTMMVGGL